MALVNVPWATGNGALNSVELARADSYIGSKGETGVCSPDHMVVSALPTPGAAVRVSRGVVVMENRYPNVFGQSYVAMETDSTDVPIPATGSTGGATRYVIVRVDDPTQGGQQPADPATGPYNRYAVVSNINGLSYPHAVLARINQPANTATITNGMITDMRAIAMPREKTVTISRPIVNADNVGRSFLLSHRLNTNGLYGEKWPDPTGLTPVPNDFPIDIPAWARRAVVEWTYYGVRYDGLSQYGGLYVVLAGVQGQDFGYDANENGGHAYQGMLGGIDNINLPASVRGTTQTLTLRAFVDTASPEAGKVKLTGRSGISVRVVFQESW